MFKAAGYQICMSGKWHIGSSRELDPISQGFDTATWIPLSNNQCKDLWLDRKVIKSPFENRMLSETFTDAARRFITDHADKPFFLYLPYTAPHFPVEPHPEWLGHSKRGKYGDVVEELDHRIGEIMSLLKQKGLDEKTLVIFTSDNGPQGGQKASAHPYRGKKWSALEGANRVPAIFRWPGQIPTGQTSDAVTAAIDLMPTLASLAGVTLEDLPNESPAIDGINIWSALAGHPNDQVDNRDFMIWHGWAEPMAIRSGPYKLYAHPSKFIEASDDGPVLIDLSKDLQEEKNLVFEYPEKADKMMKRMAALLSDIEERQMALGGKESTEPLKEAKWLENQP